MNWILFGFYIVSVFGLFVYIGIVLIHIGEFRKYSRYITPVTRIYIILIIFIAMFGGYMVLSDDIEPTSIERTPSRINLEF